MSCCRYTLHKTATTKSPEVLPYLIDNKAVHKIDHQGGYRDLSQPLEPELGVFHKKGLQVSEEVGIHNGLKEDIAPRLPGHALCGLGSSPALEKPILHLMSILNTSWEISLKSNLENLSQKLRSLNPLAPEVYSKDSRNRDFEVSEDWDSSQAVDLCSLHEAVVASIMGGKLCQKCRNPLQKTPLPHAYVIGRYHTWFHKRKRVVLKRTDKLLATISEPLHTPPPAQAPPPSPCLFKAPVSLLL